jgi:hypothetical protein
MENFNELIEKDCFIKNIKRCYFTKIIELYNIEKVSIIYNNDIKSFEIELIKNDCPYFFKYKIKRRRNKSTTKKSKKLKQVHDDSNINEENEYNDKNISKSNITSNENVSLNNNTEESNISQNDDDDNEFNNESTEESNISQNDGDDNEFNNESPDKNYENSNSNNNDIIKKDNISKIVNSLTKLFDQTTYCIDMLKEIFDLVKKGNPKKVFNKLILITNNTDNLNKIPIDFNKILNDIIKFLDEM